MADSKGKGGDGFVQALVTNLNRNMAAAGLRFGFCNEVSQGRLEFGAWYAKPEHGLVSNIDPFLKAPLSLLNSTFKAGRNEYSGRVGVVDAKDVRVTGIQSHVYMGWTEVFPLALHAKC